MNKKWYNSKTLWTNIVAGATAIAIGATNTHTPGIDINGPNGVAILAVVNAILRCVTEKKIIA